MAPALNPATALAQNGAGDEQYSDPFSGTSTPSRPKPQASPTQVQPVPHQQVQASPQTAAPAPSAAGAGTGAGSSGDQLPRTGADVLPLAGLGAALIGAGIVLLRRRGAHGRR